MSSASQGVGELRSRRFFLSVGMGLAAMAFVILVLLAQSATPGSLCLIAVLGTLIGAAGFAANPGKSGALHTAILIAVAIALLYPFLHPTFVGGGDAKDYFRTFADFLEQQRSGVREVFVGQTAFAFDGAVHFARTTPMFYHLGTLLDLLSFRTLDYLILEKITLLVFFSVSGFAFHLCCTRGLGMKPLPSLLNACVFLSAPGILAMLYFSDMYATFTALAFLPIFLTGVILLGEDSAAPGNWLLLGVGSGGLFWTHPPLAVWAHVAAFFCLLVNWRQWRAVNPRSLLYLIPLALVLAYPIVSTLELGTSWVSQPGRVAATLRQYHYEHPGAWTHLFWVSAGVTGANSFKDWSSSWVLGLPVFASLLFAAALSRRVRRAWPLLLACAVLIFLMNGVFPRAAGWLWKLVPAAVVQITFYWPLQRFNPIVICASLLGFACVMASLERRPLASRLRSAATVIQGVFLALNLLLAFEMQALPTSETIPAMPSREFVKSDNIIVSKTSYNFMNEGLALRYLTTGRSDALSEIRLHDKTDYDRVLDIFSLRDALKPEFSLKVIYRRFNFPLCDQIKIPPQAMTVLTFEGLPPGLTGTLEIRANGVSWAYLLPYSPTGEQAFGAGMNQRHSLLIRNSDPKEKTLEFYFWPPEASQEKAIGLGRMTGYTLTAPDHYFFLNGLLPFDLALDAPYPVVVETPRIFLPGYVAEVDGRKTPVFKSPQGLVALDIDRGPHRLQLSFVASPLLKSCYRLALLAWVYLLGYGAYLFSRSDPEASHEKLEA